MKPETINMIVGFGGVVLFGIIAVVVWWKAEPHKK